VSAQGSPDPVAAAQPMETLRRFTTDYVATEDRIRIRGELASGDKQVFWLTRPLLDRLVRALAAWLERSGAGASAAPAADAAANPAREMAAQRFAQQAARASLDRHEPVLAEARTANWLVRSIDLSQNRREVRLTFKSYDRPADAAAQPGDAAAGVAMVPPVLRQWLGILHDKYREAGWPAGAFPSWIGEAGAASAARPVTLH